MSSLGINQNDAVGTPGTIECSGVLQHRHLVDVFWRDGRQHIEDVTQMERLAVALHIQFHTIEDDKRLGIGID